HYVIDDSLEYLVDLAFRCKQASLLQAINDIHLGLAFPLALRLDRRSVLGSLALVLYRVGRVDRDIGKFRVTAKILQVVAPEAGLRFVVNRLANTIFQIGFFGIHERGQPDTWPHVEPPAIEVQIVTAAGMRVVCAIKTDDVVILILHPNAAKESPL